MRYARRFLPLSCLLPLAVLSACGDGSTPVSLEAPPRIDEPAPVAPTLRSPSPRIEGYASPGEVRSGYIYNRYGRPMEITYEVHDGLAIWQGDVVLGRPDQVPTSLAALAAVEGGPLPGVVIDDNAKRWPGGVVPYEIGDAPFPDRVTDAIQLIEDQTPGVKFVAHGGESNFVKFVNSTGCSSEIGMIGGQQNINLASDCSTGNAAHEILHALGMFHEHTRCDRDTYVIIHYDQVESGKEGNFYKAGASTEDGACSGASDIGTYDPGSMMHYPTGAFAIGSSPTIEAKAGVDASQMGQRDHVGPTDQATIDALYGANNAAPVAAIGALAPSYPEGSPVSLDATGSTDADDREEVLTYAWLFGDGTCPGPAPCTQANPSHTYADNGAYIVAVTVSDGFDSGNASTVATITNVDPSVSVGADATIDEGDTFTRSGSFTDPGADTWTATVNYGDGTGTSALPLAGKSFDLAHTYVDNGVNTLTVAVTDDDGGAGSDDATITVNNVPPSVDAGPDATVDSGETYDFSGTFSDPGVEDAPWGWEIQWGFGPNTTGSTSDQSAAIEASRQVCVAGDYTVRLTVTDKDGGSGWDELTLSVPYIPIEIDILPATDANPVNITKKGNLPVAILGTAELDVSQIDPSTLTLGDESNPDTPILQKNNGSYAAYTEDVNKDGRLDLVVMFDVPTLVSGGDLSMLSTQLVLRGFLADGCTNVRGVDSVQPLS